MVQVSKQSFLGGLLFMKSPGPSRWVSTQWRKNVAYTFDVASFYVVINLYPGAWGQDGRWSIDAIVTLQVITYCIRL